MNINISNEINKNNIIIKRLKNQIDGLLNNIITYYDFLNILMMFKEVDKLLNLNCQLMYKLKKIREY